MVLKMNDKELGKEDLRKITSSLEKHHAIFYKLWEVGTPKLTDDVETACVKFDKKGFCIEFLFNRNLWEKLDQNGKLFIICHECLHLILNHGVRGQNVGGKNSFDQYCLNVAMDLVINHMLTAHFHFDRSELDTFFEDLCWIDKFFLKNETEDKEFCYGLEDESGKVYFSSEDEDERKNLLERGKENKRGKTCFVNFYEKNSEIGNKTSKYLSVHPKNSFEYYYKKVKEFLDYGERKELNILDVHSELPGKFLPEGELYRDPVEETVEEASEELYENEKKELNDVLEEDLTEEEEDQDNNSAGGGSGHGIYFVPVYEDAPTYTWKMIANNSSETVFKEVEKTSWAKKNRRFSFIDNNELVLPNNYYKEERIRDNIKLWVFQDVSGSCSQYKDYFFNAITTIPKDKFNIRAFCFSGKCEEMDIEERKLVHCGGGTNFNPMNKKIEKLADDYPDLVFVITDGRSFDTNTFKRNCKYPERWKMFFSKSHSKRPLMEEMNWYFLDNLKNK